MNVLDLNVLISGSVFNIPVSHFLKTGLHFLITGLHFLMTGLHFLITGSTVGQVVPKKVPQSGDNRLSLVLSTSKVELRSTVKLLKPVGWEAPLVAVLDDLVGVHDDRDEEREHHVDEQAYKGVEVDSAVHPHRQRPILGDGLEGGKHIVAVDEGEQALRSRHDGFELEVVGSKDDPPSKHKPNIDEGGTHEEAKHVGGRPLHCQDQHVVGLEEAEVSEKTKPNQEVSSSQQQTAYIPHVADNRFGLDELLDDGAEDDHDIVGADHHVP